MMRRIALLLLCLPLLVGAGGPPRPSQFLIIWHYPPGRVVDPADVAITLHTAGAITCRDLTEYGGKVCVRVPGRRACYTVSIVVPGARYDAHDWSECPTTHLPLVSAP